MGLKKFVQNLAAASAVFGIIDTAHNTEEINQKLDDISSELSHGLTDANYKLEDINESIQQFEKATVAEITRLKQSVEKGFSEISLELAVQSNILKNIDRSLHNKVALEAEEYKRFGINALQNKWFLDAKTDFEKSIELNRYDYKVYYLMSKCYEGLEEKQKQDEYLEKAFHYANKDPYFQQYIGLDIVGLLMEDGELEEAQKAAETIINLLPEGKRKQSPLLLCQLKINIKTNVINDDTLLIVDSLIDSHDYKYQIKMIKVIMALIDSIEGDYKTKINNLLNLKKANLSKTCALLLQNSLHNTKNLINNYIRLNVKNVDKHLEDLFIPDKRIMQMCMNDDFNIVISSVDDFNKYYVLMSEAMDMERRMTNIMRNDLGNMTDIFKEIKKAPKDSQELIDENDRIVWQVIDGKDSISVTFKNLIVAIDAHSKFKKPQTYTYGLDSLYMLEFEKFNECDAFDDFIRMYDIEDSSDIQFYRNLFYKNNIKLTKYCYVIRDTVNNFNILMGIMYCFNTMIVEDLCDRSVKGDENKLLAIIKNYYTQEDLWEKAYKLRNARITMNKMSQIFSSFISMVNMLSDNGDSSTKVSNNEDIEFVD